MEIDDNWVRLSDRKLRNTIKNGPSTEARTYGLNGNLWPRLNLVITKNSVSWGYKKGPGLWWDSNAREIPMSVLKDIPEVIHALLSRMCV